MSQEILERIKALNAAPELDGDNLDAPTETAEGELDAEADINASVIPDGVEETEIEELDEGSTDEDSTTNDGEESYFDIEGEETSLSQILEWRDGGLRDADYRNKTTAVAEKRKDLERKESTIDESIAELGTTISELRGIIQAEEASINWDELADEDPAEYLKQQRKLDAKKAAIKTAESKQQKQLNDKMAEESNILISKMEGWSDEKVMNSEFQAAVDYAKTIGLSLSGVSDHSLYMALVDASKYKALKAKKAGTVQKVREAPKVVRATKGRPKAKQTDFEAAKARLQKTGSKSDAVAAIRQLQNR